MGCAIDEQRYFPRKLCAQISVAETKSTRLFVRISASEYLKVKDAAKAKGTTTSELIRRGLKSQGVTL
jgi:hypothetical protein